MKKILITRRLIRESEDKASKLFEAKFNSNDELYSQSKIIEMSKGCDGILSSLTEKLDADTINKLPDSIKIISNEDTAEPVQHQHGLRRQDQRYNPKLRESRKI